MLIHKTPLRYPGGKARLAPFARRLLQLNALCDGQYAEPYAGGAGIAVDLLLTEHVRGIHLNDACHHVYCFWRAILTSPEYLCRRATNVRVTPNTWRRQRAILLDPHNHSPEEVGFAFLFLNRTNRSGIMSGGMIGGLQQSGKWRIDARFYRAELTRRIEQIAEYAHRIFVYNMDAEEFVRSVVNKLNGKCCVYYDPPYYEAGQRLYLNNYKPHDHARISSLIQNETRHHWFLTYDNQKAIRSLYSSRRQRRFRLNYSAAASRVGTELMVFSDSLRIPSRWRHA